MKFSEIYSVTDKNKKVEYSDGSVRPAEKNFRSEVAAKALYDSLTNADFSKIDEDNKIVLIASK